MNNFIAFLSSLGCGEQDLSLAQTVPALQAETEIQESPQTPQHSHETPTGQPGTLIHGCNSQHRESQQGKGPMAWLQGLGAALGTFPTPNLIQPHGTGPRAGHTPGHGLQPGIPAVRAAREAIPVLLITPGARGSGSPGDVLFPQKLEALEVGFSQHRHDLGAAAAPRAAPLTSDILKHK